MKSAKALIFPSLWYEGAPLTPLEAMQFGVPVVSSSCNAAIDYINNENGYIYDNITELKKCILNIDNASLNPDKIIIPSKYLTNYSLKLRETYERVFNDAE